MIAIIATAIACFIVGGVLSYILFRYALKSKYDNVLKEAETEAEVIKKNKLLEVKEKFLNKKADLEKEVALRNQKIQQAENKLKQREMVLGQRQEEIQRKKMEAEAVKENLEEGSSGRCGLLYQSGRHCQLLRGRHAAHGAGTDPHHAAEHQGRAFKRCAGFPGYGERFRRFTQGDFY